MLLPVETTEEQTTMKTTALAAAALVSLAAITAALADSPNLSQTAQAAPAPRADDPIRVAEALLGRFWDRDGHDEYHGRHHRWRDDADADDDAEDGDGDGGREHHARGASDRPVDPNPSTAPVPDNGIFTGKARPKVEVQ